VAIVLSISRGVLCYQKMEMKYDERLLKAVLDLELLEALLVIIDAMLLLEAISRFRRSLTRNPSFVQNRRTMCLHFFVMFGHAIVLALLSAMLVYAVRDPKRETKISVDILRIGYVVTQSGGWLCLIYLLIKLAQPITVPPSYEPLSLTESLDANELRQFYCFIRESIEVSRTSRSDSQETSQSLRS
jgi:hypothetical protein